MRVCSCARMPGFAGKNIPHGGSFMRKTWKRIVSVMMALAMVVLCLPGYSNPVKTAKAAAAGVSYIDASGETQTYTGTYRSIRGGGNANTNRPTTWTSGWYVVEPFNG